MGEAYWIQYFAAGDVHYPSSYDDMDAMEKLWIYLLKYTWGHKSVFCSQNIDIFDSTDTSEFDDENLMGDSYHPFTFF